MSTCYLLAIVLQGKKTRLPKKHLGWEEDLPDSLATDIFLETNVLKNGFPVINAIVFYYNTLTSSNLSKLILGNMQFRICVQCTINGGTMEIVNPTGQMSPPPHLVLLGGSREIFSPLSL